tara:strand:- start:125 stop:439 length:315 start_codon:yes stop_codon:yes gene_type:complete
MIQADLFPYLIDQNFIKYYLKNKKEIKKIDRKIGKIARENINLQIACKQLQKHKKENVIQFKDYYLYRLDREIDHLNQKLLFHYEKRKKYLAEQVGHFQYLINC